MHFRSSLLSVVSTGSHRSVCASSRASPDFGDDAVLSPTISSSSSIVFGIDSALRDSEVLEWSVLLPSTKRRLADSVLLCREILVDNFMSYCCRWYVRFPCFKKSGKHISGTPVIIARNE